MDPNVYANDGTSKYIDSGVQLISRCISSTPNPTIKNLCENPDIDRDIETLIPVTDYSTGLRYRNQYCALCSDQTSYDRIRRWDMNIDCEDDVSYTYEQLYHIFRDRTCNISFSLSDSLPVESCVPYEIGTCNVSGHWKVYNETLERACNSFIDPFNLTYKNVFCFLCNVDTSISVDLSQCRTYNYTRNLKLANFANVPFLAMLDLSAVLMKQTSIHAVQLKCNKHVQFADAKVVSTVLCMFVLFSITFFIIMIAHS